MMYGKVEVLKAYIIYILLDQPFFKAEIKALSGDTLQLHATTLHHFTIISILFGTV